MAVQSYFTNYDKTKEPYSAVKACGVNVHHFQNTAAVLAADDAASTYLIMKNVSAHQSLLSLGIEHDSITGANSCDVGFYDSVSGSALTKQDGSSGKAVLAAGLDFTTANNKITQKDGLAAITHTQTTQPIWQLLGFTHPKDAKPQYDLVVTLNNDPSAPGNITARGTLRPVG